jgi:leucine dehydrogenase
MKIFGYMVDHHHEEVAFWADKATGLKAIVAIHSTVLGPALGGTRMWPYPTEEEALLDVLRLSEAMTYKASVAGLDLGGGKAVIIGDPAVDKSDALFRSFGRFINSLNGRYITAEDVGTTVADMTCVHEETPYVTGLPAAEKGSGDPSPMTAYGVYRGLKACCQARYGTNELEGCRVAIQGLGKVGHHLAWHLAKEGVEIVASECNPRRAEQVRAEIKLELVDLDEIYRIGCDIFAPCALGGILNDDTIPYLRCQIIAGGANNQLAEDRHGFELAERDILYAPDYVINSGGIISVATELGSYDTHEAVRKTAAIYDTVLRVIALAKDEEIPTHLAAHRLAQARIELKTQEFKVLAGG